MALNAPCAWSTWPIPPVIEKTSMLLASPTHCRPSEAVPQKTWGARRKVSCARMVPPFAVEGVGPGDLAVPMGMVGPIFVDGFVLTLNGSVNAASMEGEESPAGD